MAEKQQEVRKPTISIFGLSPELARALTPIKLSLDLITGRGTKEREIKGLKDSATNAEIIAKINEICRRINASGTC